MEQLLLRAEEAAKILGIGRAKTYEMIASGELPSVRVGRAVRVPASRLGQWIEDRIEGSGGAGPNGHGPEK